MRNQRTFSIAEQKSRQLEEKDIEKNSDFYSTAELRNRFSKEIETIIEQEKVKLKAALDKQNLDLLELLKIEKLKELDLEVKRQKELSEDLLAVILELETKKIEERRQSDKVALTDMTTLIMTLLYKLFSEKSFNQHFVEQTILDVVERSAADLRVKLMVSTQIYGALSTSVEFSKIKKIVIVDERLGSGEIYLDCDHSVRNLGIVDQLDHVRDVFLDQIEKLYEH